MTRGMKGCYVYCVNENLQNYIKENDISCDFLLDSILSFLNSQLKNSNKTISERKILDDIKALSEAKKHLGASMSDKVVLDTLFLKMTRGRK